MLASPFLSLQSMLSSDRIQGDVPNSSNGLACTHVCSGGRHHNRSSNHCVALVWDTHRREYPTAQQAQQDTGPCRWQDCAETVQRTRLEPQLMQATLCSDALVTLRHRQLRVDPSLASCVESCSSMWITGLCILPNISEAAQSFITTRA